MVRSRAKTSVFTADRESLPCICNRRENRLMQPRAWEQDEWIGRNQNVERSS
jgi:hypothetical protein